MPAIRLQNLALAVVILLALSAGHRPAVAQNFTEFPIPTAGSNPTGITTAQHYLSNGSFDGPVRGFPRIAVNRRGYCQRNTRT